MNDQCYNEHFFYGKCNSETKYQCVDCGTHSCPCHIHHTKLIFAPLCDECNEIYRRNSREGFKKWQEEIKAHPATCDPNGIEDELELNPFWTWAALEEEQ